MPSLPGQRPTVTAGQPATADQARQFLAAVEDAMRIPTSYRDDSPTPAIGSAPPVPQPGRPPMSQKAVDTSTVMLSAGIASLPIGAVAIGILIASGQADSTVIACICAAPAGLAVPVAAASRFLRRAKEVVEAAPPAEVHNHIHGDAHVHQDQRQSKTTGVWAKTNNQQ